MRDLVARQAPGEPDVTQLMNNPGLAAGAGRTEATQTDLLNYVLQKAFGHKPGLETNPELCAEQNSDFLLSEVHLDGFFSAYISEFKIESLFLHV